MGANFNAMHLRLVSALNDVNRTTGAQIVAASEDGKKRTSAQRSRDLMDGRYYVMSILRIVDRQIFYGIREDEQFSTGGFLDITGFNVINHGDIYLHETSSRYNKPVPVVDGDELPVYRTFLRTFMTNDLVAAVVNDNSQATRMTQLRLIKGANLQGNLDEFVFDVGFYTLPILAELDYNSGTDITEPRIWWPLIESYALYLGWLGSGNTKRAIPQLDQTQRLAQMIVQNEYGASAARKLAQSRVANDTVND